MRLQLQECVNSKGILFAIYKHRTQPVNNYNHTPHKVYNIDSNSYGLKGHSIFKSFYNFEASWTAPFGITYRQLQPKLFLPAGPSATKHGPNSSPFMVLDRFS
jgi:hypothetical protein